MTTRMLKRVFLLYLLYFLCLLNIPAFAQQQPAGDAALIAELRAKLQRDLEHIAAGFDGAIGIAAQDLTTGETLAVNGGTVFPQASSIKIPILLKLLEEAQAGRLNLTERIEVGRSIMTGGSGILQRFGDATSALSLRDIAVLMIVLSDNTATNILIDRLTMDAVNAMLTRHGLQRTRLQRRMMDTEAQRASRENLSTPQEMVALLEMMYVGKLLDAQHTALALEILSYPKDTPLRRGVPAGVEVANKPGGLTGVSCDSGIVLLSGRPFAIAVMTTYGAGDGPTAITEATRKVFAYFERLARANAHGARVR